MLKSAFKERGATINYFPSGANALQLIKNNYNINVNQEE